MDSSAVIMLSTGVRFHTTSLAQPAGAKPWTRLPTRERSWLEGRSQHAERNRTFCPANAHKHRISV